MEKQQQKSVDELIEHSKFEIPEVKKTSTKFKNHYSVTLDNRA